MNEGENSFENQEPKEKTPRPNTLDVIKIDGRWAQVIAPGGSIKYLDDESLAFIDWQDYLYIKDWEKLTVSDVKKLSNFPKEELERVHWGPEQKKHPYLREQVRVFGEFNKRNPDKII